MASINLQGDTSGSISISAPSVAGSNTLTLPATTQTLATQNSLGVRNRIINGDMRIDQRNAGAAVTANLAYPVDRFQVSNGTDGTFSAQQSTTIVPSGFTTSVGITITAEDTSLGVTQALTLVHKPEGYNISDFGWGTADAKTVTLSFWVRSSLTGLFGGALRNSAANRSYPFSYTISVADTWEQKSITIAGETTGTWLTTNGTGIILTFALGAGVDRSGTAGAWNSNSNASATGATSVVGTNGATFYITGVQLEVGDTATPFEHRPYDMELRRCLRYYYKNIGNGSGTGPYGMGHCRSNYLRGQIWLPVTMRATPTMTNTGTDADYIVTSGTSDFTSFVTRPSLDGGGPDGLNFRVQVSSGMTNGYAALLYLNSSNSYLEFSAEL